MVKDFWEGILHQDWQDIFKITAFECQEKILHNPKILCLQARIADRQERKETTNS
jgi:hypothetical protein